MKERGFTEEEKAAMRERIEEMKMKDSEMETKVIEKIEQMSEDDRQIAKKLHKIILETLPDLKSRLWYGMPAYSKGDKLICYFQPSGKFKARYSLLGFTDKAKLDEGNLWPVAFAIKRLTTSEEKKIKELLIKAIG